MKVHGRGHTKMFWNWNRPSQESDSPANQGMAVGKLDPLVEGLKAKLTARDLEIANLKGDVHERDLTRMNIEADYEAKLLSEMNRANEWQSRAEDLILLLMPFFESMELESVSVCLQLHAERFVRLSSEAKIIFQAAKSARSDPTQPALVEAADSSPANESGK